MSTSVPYEVHFPYLRSTGSGLERFFDGLSKGVLWGRHCASCDGVVVPARDYCDTCGGDLGDWREVAQEGIVQAITVIEHDAPLSELTPPFGVVAVRLDGTCTNFIHLARRLDGLVPGARCRLVWAENRSGSIRDIDGFEASS